VYAWSTFCSSIAIVIGPTPPGTGVMSAIFAIFSVSQSPKSFRHSVPCSTLMPTSMTRAHGATISSVMRCFLPTADTMISAFFVCDERFFVRLWQIVTVAPAWRRRRTSGLPTIVLFPMTTACFHAIFNLQSSIFNQGFSFFHAK